MSSLFFLCASPNEVPRFLLHWVAGSKVDCVQYIGVAESTTLARVYVESKGFRFPPIKSSIHPISDNWKRTRRSTSHNGRDSKVLSRLVEIRILEDAEILHATSLSMSTEKAMLDLGRLIFCPEVE